MVNATTLIRVTRTLSQAPHPTKGALPCFQHFFVVWCKQEETRCREARDRFIHALRCNSVTGKEEP